MDAIRIKKDELLAAVKKNREGHRAVFEEALEGYRKQAVAELEAILAEAKAGKRIRRGVSLIEPTDQTREYDRIIRALEMSTDQVIELSEGEFAQYVMDDWHWKGQFIATTQAYMSH